MSFPERFPIQIGARRLCLNVLVPVSSWLITVAFSLGVLSSAGDLPGRSLTTPSQLALQHSNLRAVWQPPQHQWAAAGAEQVFNFFLEQNQNIFIFSAYTDACTSS